MIPAAQEQPWDQVAPTRASGTSFRDRQRAPAPLPLEGQAVPWKGGWEVRLPVRAERIVVEKQVVAVERITVRRGRVTETVPLHETIAREELRVEPAGDVEVSGDDDTLRGQPPE